MDEGNSILTKKRLRQSARPGTISYVCQRRFVIAGYRIVCGDRKMNLLARNCADERVSEAAYRKSVRQRFAARLRGRKAAIVGLP